TWVTQTETNVQGFYIYRNMANDLSSALQLSGMIPATNTSQQQVYQFTDKELNQTGTYYYWLMVADMDGSEGFHGPISLNYEQGGLQLPEIPKFTELKNVYPNPFNPSTTISYALANSQNVNFNIFNNRGQMVRSMELGNKAAGNHSFVWDGCDNYGRSVSTGVYFIRMQAGSESFSKKAVLMK
ncbi:MAG: FlgD immunoglobulin-like domain containing protein, partial [Candidatus Cloacimonadaceae bacterium]|nr:FlgD immunoglobulin-like domain containing protein [Candidatus Cloacimonadaceae bacterium]